MGFNVDRITEAVEAALKDHMAKQPYSVICAYCGADLTCYADVDCGYDLRIGVMPCECTQTKDIQ